MSAAESVSIRRAVPADAPALARLRWDSSVEEGMAAESYAEFASGFAEFVRGALADGRWVIWVAELDGRLVAQIYVQVVGMVPRPGRFARRWGSLGGRLRRAGGAQQGDRVPRAAERRRLGQARGAGIPRRVAQRARRSVLRARGVRPRP